MRRYRTRASSLLSPPPPSFDSSPRVPFYSPFFRPSSPRATWSRSSRYGNRAESRWETSPPPPILSLPFPTTLRCAPLAASPRHVFDSYSLSLSRSPHLSLIQPACQPALSFSSHPSSRLVSLTHARRIVMGNVQMH